MRLRVLLAYILVAFGPLAPRTVYATCGEDCDAQYSSNIDDCRSQFGDDPADADDLAAWPSSSIWKQWMRIKPHRELVSTRSCLLPLRGWENSRWKAQLPARPGLVWRRPALAPSRRY